MRRNRKLALAVAATTAVTLAIAPATAATAQPSVPSQQPLTAQEAAALSLDTNTPVIVLMKDQPAAATKNSAAAATRAQGITTAQRPLMSELSQVRAQHVRTYTLANAVAATVSKAEAARLSANPSVAAVLPDVLVKGAPLAKNQQPPANAAAAAPNIQGICPAPGAKPLLEPEALSVTHTNSDDPTAKTARSLGFTGAGVKVAYIAEGIDTNNPDFIRADGSHVFADYQDFTGDGPNAPTSGGEAFLDASAIAAQGRGVYDISHFGAHPLAGPCDVRIEGVAPGASLFGFKVFGNQNFSTTSAILQSIQWAVNVDHVDVINESFGFDPFPDNGAQDAVRLFDDMAVAAGVSVTVSTGDAGPTNTQGSPASDPNVIATGASTTFRWLSQTDYAGAQQFAPGGWVSDNISELSSSGVTPDGRTIDLLAPGDTSFALCTANPAQFASCADFNGKPSNVERSGGTSESAPLTAGAAALVIQAYRQAHHGASPSPALVKRILVSTADDLGVPGAEQGAGRLNTAKAVQAAESVGSATATGSTLLVNQTQLDATGPQGSLQHWQLKVTNTGATAQDVRLSGRGFGAPQHTVTGSVTLSDTASPHFADWSGVNNNFGELHFTVGPNTDRLQGFIAYPGDPNGSLNARVRLILVDPLGRIAAHSLPQGVGNAGFADVRFPVAGQWTAVIFGRDHASGGTVGTVRFAANTQNATGFGTVSPAVLHLAPGQTQTATVTATTPAQPGDGNGSVVLDAGAAGRTSVPVIVRSLIGTAHGSGSFSGTLTGGNGRQSDLGQEQFYQFDVPAGTKDIATSIDIANDPNDNVAAFLIDPTHQSAAAGINRLNTSYDLSTRDGNQQATRQTDLYVHNPKAGRWMLVVNFADPVVGNELSQPFTGRVAFNSVDAHASGLPDSAGTTLPAGKAVTVPVTVHNTGTGPQNFFVDARLDELTGLRLTAAEPATLPLPMPGTAASPAWLVPSETNAVALIAAATQPVMFDYGPVAGDPDLPSIVNGTTAIGAVHGNPLASGLWATAPSELGPTPAAGGAAGSVTFDAVALTRAFDPAVSSPATDLWLGSASPVGAFHLITVQPGQSATIPVTITPSGRKGTVVRGTLFVDQLVVGSTGVVNDINFADPAPTEPNANELVGIPYQYTIG